MDPMAENTTEEKYNCKTKPGRAVEWTPAVNSCRDGRQIGVSRRQWNKCGVDQIVDNTCR